MTEMTNKLLETDEPAAMNLDEFLSGKEESQSEDSEELVLGQISLRFPEKLIQKIRKKAKAENMMFSEYLRRLLIRGMSAEGIL